MSLDHFTTWLYASALSTEIREYFWIVPTVQSIHILAIAILLGSAVMSDLRLANMLATDEPSARVVRRYFPWMRNALIVLLLTGLLMVIGEPDRVLHNTTFWIKMALIVGVFSLSWLVRRPLLRQGPGAQNVEAGSLAKPAAWLSLLLWCTVIVCGRWIAYT